MAVKLVENHPRASWAPSDPEGASAAFVKTMCGPTVVSATRGGGKVKYGPVIVPMEVLSVIVGLVNVVGVWVGSGSGYRSPEWLYISAPHVHLPVITALAATTSDGAVNRTVL